MPRELRGAVNLGLLGAVLITVGSWGVGFMASSQRSILARLAFFVPFRVPVAGLVLSTVVLVLGALVLTRAWIALGRTATIVTDPEERTRAVVRASFLWCLPLLLSLPVFSRDVFSYATQGRLLNQGGNPYSDWVSQMPGWLGEGADVLWAESSSPYGPLFLLLARVVYAVSGGVPEVNIVLFRLLALGGMWLTAWALPKLARHPGSDPAWATWMVVANPLWLLSMVASAHNDSLMVGCILLAFALAREGKLYPALLLAAAAIAIKPIVILGLPFLGLALAGSPARLPGLRAGAGEWARRWSAWATTALVVGLVMAVLGWVTGLWFGWIQAMADQGSAAAAFAPYGLIGMGIGALISFFGGPGAPIQDGFYTAGKVAAVLLTFWLALRRPRMSPLLGFSLSLGAAIVLAPTVQPWYLLWLLPLLASWRSWWGTWESVAIGASGFTAVAGTVWALSLPEWVHAPSLYLVGAAVGVLGMAFLACCDGGVRGIWNCVRLSQARTIAPSSVLADPVLPWRPAWLDALLKRLSQIPLLSLTRPERSKESTRS